MNNIVKAVFGAFRECRTRNLWQWDYGMRLQFVGLDLPETYTVHQANEPLSGNAKTYIGDETGVDILNEYLTTGKNVYVWLYLHTGDADGETVYMVTIPVRQRPRPTEDEPTPVQRGLIEDALQIMSADVAAAEAAATRAENASEYATEARDAAILANASAKAANDAADAANAAAANYGNLETDAFSDRTAFNYAYMIIQAEMRNMQNRIEALESRANA